VLHNPNKQRAVLCVLCVYSIVTGEYAEPPVKVHCREHTVFAAVTAAFALIIEIKTGAFTST
jgi:hypothetical protein